MEHDGVYHVGYDIPVGMYTYVANDQSGGYWALCKDAKCSQIIQNAVPSHGDTGYIDMTVAGANYVKLRGLTLRPVK